MQQNDTSNPRTNIDAENPVPNSTPPNPDAPKAFGARTDRRSFLGQAGRAIVAASGLALLAKNAGADLGPQTPQQRAQTSRSIRINAANADYAAGWPGHPTNNDEFLYPEKWGNYSKALAHDQYGQVTPQSYRSLIHALETGRPSDFENIQLGGPRVLTDPQAALGFDLESWDSHALAIPPAPALASAETAGEMVECYWMALARDVPFTNFGTDPTCALACKDLSSMSDFKGPKVGGNITPTTLFRGNLNGDLDGPIISQFLWQNLPYGALTIPQTITSAVPNVDYMTTFANWLAVQNGTFTGTTTLDESTKYISSMRDMGQWVHVDQLYETYLNACLILLGNNYPLDPGNPYVTSKTQTGFGTFGGPHILSLCTEVATRALKAVWYQKWAVHRRIRPEAYGGLMQLKVTKTIPDIPLHPDVLNSAAVAGGYVFNHNAANNAANYGTSDGTYLLPMAFSEGSPTHPSYGEGHGTVGGACVTILKAWFDETTQIQNPVMASADGSQLVPYTGPPLTVQGELNKAASNVAVGRCMAGVHWRSDYYQAVLLGEAIAIRLLQEQKATYNEPSALSLTKFDGTTITI